MAEHQNQFCKISSQNRLYIASVLEDQGVKKIDVSCNCKDAYRNSIAHHRPQVVLVFFGAVGFILGRSLAQQLLIGKPVWTVIFIAVATGLVGLIFGLYAQRFAVGIAGFLMGRYALASLGFAMGFYGTGWIWLALVGGGLIGTALALISLDFAFIFLTTAAGAKLIEQTIDLDPLLNFALFAVLFAVGVTNQLIMLKK